MRIGFITKGAVGSFSTEKKEISADIYCFSFGALGMVDYEKEVRGETNEMEECAIFSRNFSCLAVFGCYTSTKGVKRKSAIVADHGKILGVSDCNYAFDNEPFGCGAGLRVYDTSLGKIGVVVAQDVYFADTVKTLTKCGAELVLCLFEEVGENIEQILLRADAFRYGVTIGMCARSFAQIAEPSGNLAFASPDAYSFYKVEKESEYHLVGTRRRGFLRQKRMF